MKYKIVLIGLILAVSSLAQAEIYVDELQLDCVGSEVVFKIHAGGATQYTHEIAEAKEGKPFRVIVDVFPALHNLSAKDFDNLPQSIITSIRTSQYSVKPAKIVRMVLDLKDNSVYRIEKNNEWIYVYIPDEHQPTFSTWSSGKQTVTPANKVADAKPPVIAVIPPPQTLPEKTAAIQFEKKAEAPKPSPVLADKKEAKPLLSKENPAIKEPSPVSPKETAIIKETKPAPSLTAVPSPDQKPVSMPENTTTKKQAPIQPAENMAVKEAKPVLAPEATPSKESQSAPLYANAATPVPYAYNKLENSSSLDFRRVEMVAAPATEKKVVPPAEPAKTSETTKIDNIMEKADTMPSENNPQAEPKVMPVRQETTPPSVKPDAEIKEKPTEKILKNNKNELAATATGTIAEPIEETTEITDNDSDVTPADFLPAQTFTDANSGEPSKNPSVADPGLANSESDKKETSRFRRQPAFSAKMKGTIVAEFPQRMVIKYEIGDPRDPFGSLINKEAAKYDDLDIHRIPDVETSRLVGILESVDGTNRALLEDVDGYGYILRQGDKVKKGYVSNIYSDKALFQLFEYGWSRTVALSLKEN